MKKISVRAFALLILALPFCGCLMYNALWRVRLYFSETPKIIYNDLGITATEWGTQLVHLVEIDLSRTAITSVVCAVDGETIVLCNKADSSVAPELEVHEGCNFILGGESWEISLIKSVPDDHHVAWINNCSTNTVIHVKVNEVGFTIPCEEADLVGSLGTNYFKTIVRGML